MDEWTEEEIGKVAVKADKAATKKHWEKAIRYGERMLKGSEALYGQDSPYYTSRLKTLIRYYDKAGHLDQIPEKVEKAYIQSKKYFDPKHDTATISRLVYYKLLITQKKFSKAIPLVYENMAILKNTEDDDFRKLHYLGQLNGLYGITGQFVLQEKILLEQLDLNKRLIGLTTKDNIKIIMNLAKNYCRRKLDAEFDTLVQTYGLKYKC
ncbi:hypothetical protein CRD36_10685 [Paremcibacter congregatus]|uniref:Uncharacterized protein n=2 Tax=Paremcibacter congregatus TaxID=2043170 RepID=A0A2G4YR00_9PROT|nr:hypothetical protein CRD36_10685 [Paremcibacter congregatus]